MHVARVDDPLLDHVADRGGQFLVRQRRGKAVEEGVRLERQVIEGEMRRAGRERFRHVGLGLGERLPGQRIHQVEVEVVEARMRDLDRAPRLAIVVDPAERLQVSPD